MLVKQLVFTLYTTSEEPESTPTEFGGQWAERTRPLIEEVEGDNPTKTEMAMVEVIEDLEVEAYRYIGLAIYRLPIWQNFQYRESVFFEIVPIFLLIFKH